MHLEDKASAGRRRVKSLILENPIETQQAAQPGEVAVMRIQQDEVICGRSQLAGNGFPRGLSQHSIANTRGKI